MKQAICRVAGILEEEKALFGRFLARAGEKRSFIVHGTVDALDALVREENEELDRLALLELDRRELMESVAGAAGGGELNIARLAELAEDPELSRRLLSLRDELRPILQKQAHMNRLNQTLLEAKRQYAEVMLEAYTGAEQLDNNYGLDRYAEGGAPETRLFDRQI